MKTIQDGTKFRIFDDSIRTYDNLPAFTFNIGYSNEEGCYLIQRADVTISEKAYGVHSIKADKVLDSFRLFERNLGVILSGDKGIGKSMFAKLVCVKAVQYGYPVIIVDACYPGIARFIESIEQECVVLFDEFDKTFRCNQNNDDQAALLSMFDGTSNGKKMFVVTCNDIFRLNSFIVNRPGRFHYHFRFDYPSENDIREYLTDRLKPEYYGEIERVTEFARKVSLNYDCLRAIAFEINNGNSFADAISDLNIMTTENEEYRVYLYFNNGMSVHNLRYTTNLYDYDGSMTNIHFYDNDGRYVLTACFDKGAVRYDAVKGKIYVPSGAIKIREQNCDDDFYDDDDSVVNDRALQYRRAKVLYMTFEKRSTDNLHYMV